MTKLIFLPGMACDASVWRAQMATLSPSWQVEVSDVHFRHSSIEAMASGLLKETGSSELVLCGASMGGMIAMEAVRQCPQRIAGLALLGTSARPETAEIQTLREAAIKLYEQGRVEEVLLANLQFAFHEDGRTNSALTREYLSVIMSAGAEQLVLQNRAVIRRPDARIHLPFVRCPTLVVWGDSDQLTPPECSRELVSMIPLARGIEIPRCGHMLTMERPEVVSTALREWLSKLQAS